MAYDWRKKHKGENLEAYLERQREFLGPKEIVQMRIAIASITESSPDFLTTIPATQIVRMTGLHDDLNELQRNLGKNEEFCKVCPNKDKVYSCACCNVRNYSEMLRESWETGIEWNRRDEQIIGEDDGEIDDILPNFEPTIDENNKLLTFLRTREDLINAENARIEDIYFDELAKAVKAKRESDEKKIRKFEEISGQDTRAQELDKKAVAKSLKESKDKFSAARKSAAKDAKTHKK